ncbi:MAG: hypothetical protein JWQ71_4623 [Pedosphaera sp.]|nr:hypothetical protein [Pedosphaera sp.]
MAVIENPALKQFVAHIGSELVLAQVFIRQNNSGYELRHVEDRSAIPDSLRLLNVNEVRTLVQYTATGIFRPLKSAPNLPGGWRLLLSGDVELETALNLFYPGAIADWYAVQGGNPPVTHYREFTNRQSGMYRITTMLNDAQAAQVIKAGCDKKFCLKRRLWTVAGLESDGAGEKSLIPCLEPCAVLMEFARKAVRIEQQEKVCLEISPDEVATLQVALANMLMQPDAEIREGDISAPGNPRRLQLVLEKLRPFLKLARDPEKE